MSPHAFMHMHTFQKCNLLKYIDCNENIFVNEMEDLYRQ